MNYSPHDPESPTSTSDVPENTNAPAQKTALKIQPLRSTPAGAHASGEYDPSHRSTAFPNGLGDSSQPLANFKQSIADAHAAQPLHDEGNDETSELQATKTNRNTTALSWLIIIIVAIALSYFIRFFIATPYEIPSPSMDDTIAIGDRVMSERVSYYFGEPQAGQIITFADPEPNINRTLIKRVIATEGQTVDLIDGDVYVDGEKLDEPYVDDNKSYPLSETLKGVEISYPYTVPEGHVWVMGDNRDESADSRYFGPVDVATVSGHAFMRYWPLDKIGGLD